MKNGKPYVGIKNGQRTIFWSHTPPTSQEYGHIYNAIIGPFKTMNGAAYMALHGGNNPHLQTVKDAERLAKLNT